MLNPNGPAIEYAALTKLVDLAEQIAEQNKRSKIVKPLAQAAKIRYWLKALEDKEYLTDLQINRIWQCLTQVAELNEIPSGLALNEVPAPAISIGPQGPQGVQGIPGQDGFGTDFAQINLTTNTVVDSFPISSALAAKWDYILVSLVGQRTGEIRATWTADGVSSTYFETSTVDVFGDTTPVVFTVTIVGATVQLNANISSGTWNISGTRWYTPGNGAGTGPVNAVLPSSQIFVGNASNVATAVSMSGDATISNTGVLSLGNGVVDDLNVAAGAAIATNKLAPKTASRIAVFDGSGFLTASAISSASVIGGAGANTRVPFWTSANNLSSNVNFTYDSATNALLVGGVTIDDNTITGLSGLNLTGFGAPIVSQIRHEFTPNASNAGLRIGVVAGDPSSLSNSDIWYNSTSHTINARINGVTESLLTSLNGVKIKDIQIGDWDMDTTGSVTVAHGLSDITKIISISGMIIRDDSALTFVIKGDASISNVTPTDITLTRTAAGFFDGVNFNSTSFNRGWITIIYKV